MDDEAEHRAGRAHSVALGKGPEATKRSMSPDARPRQSVRSTANKMSSVPQIAVAMAIGRNMSGMVADACRTSSVFSANVAIFRRMTSFSPDQVSSTAQTFTSTSPIGSATSRITSSVMSVGDFRRLLRPADPDEAGAVEQREQTRELALELVAAR